MCGLFIRSCDATQEYSDVKKWVEEQLGESLPDDLWEARNARADARSHPSTMWTVALRHPGSHQPSALLADMGSP